MRTSRFQIGWDLVFELGFKVGMILVARVGFPLECYIHIFPGFALKKIIWYIRKIFGWSFMCHTVWIDD